MMAAYVYSAIAAVIAGAWLCWRYRNRKLLDISKEIPGPKPLPVLGNALLFMVQPEELVNVIQNMITQYGSWFRFWLGPDLNVVVSDPDDLKLLLSNPKMSVKGPQYKYMADILGGGILSGSGPTWRRHRKIASPNYGKRTIECYGNIFNKEVDHFLQICYELPQGGNVNIYSYIVRCTSYAVCQTLLGLNKDQTMKLPYLQKIIDQTPTLYDIVFNRMSRWWYQIDPLYWLTNDSRFQDNFQTVLEEFSRVIVEHSIDKLNTMEDEKKINLLNDDEDSIKNIELSVVDRFILSKELNGEELLKEVFTIFTSSQEATAKIASSLIHMMAYHPNCQERLYNEIKLVIGEKDYVTEEDFTKMPYLEMVFKEIVRLFPIGALLQRTVAEDIVISKYTLPSGCSLLAPVYHLHRDPRFWERPNEFDPDRFNKENTSRRQPNCYIPFSLGPMDCLGRLFGRKLVKTICVRFLREFKVIACDKYVDMKMTIAISAAPTAGYRVIVCQR